MRSVAVLAFITDVVRAQLRPFQNVVRPAFPPSGLFNPSARPVGFVPSRSITSPSFAQLRTSISLPEEHPASPLGYSSNHASSETFPESANTVTLYRIQGDECSEATMDKQAGSIVMRLVKLRQGTCASEGFLEAGGAETMTAPLVGEITVSTFRKHGWTDPSVAEQFAGSTTATLHKISKGECGEVVIDKYYAAFAVYFANLKRGTCESQGFTEADGRTQMITLPLLGKSSVNYFKRKGKGWVPLRPLRAKVRALSVAASTAALAGGAVGGAVSAAAGTGSQNPEMFAQTERDVTSVHAVVLIGLCVGSAVVVFWHRLRSRGSGTSGLPPILHV